MSILEVILLSGRLFLRLFEVCFASWDVEGMVLVIEVSVSTAGHVAVGIDGLDFDGDVTVTKDVNGKSAAVVEEVEGSSCAWVEDDVNSNSRSGW
ncbi:hypothetical protein TNCV_4072771 [Trichonephila clavipes]|uniref:Uncharacterized protein n=1 Tax=Trichonephila clavipes TaxID=2585209 RepID=A0A8X6W872_TRICX|nr:hypothetical protein TNCV_4072771 [Trichonephila clavipes]